jgi:plasmid stabilization system protein ParE
MIRWTPKSEADLDLIIEHIANNFNFELAVQVVYEVIDYVEDTLTKNPLAGKILTSNPLFFKLVYKGNSIYYCENPRNKYLYIVYVQARGQKWVSSRLNRTQVA